MSDAIAGCETDTVEPEITFNGQAADNYPVISRSAQERLIDTLHESFPERCVNRNLGRIWDWKRSSYGNYARSHSLAMKAVHDVDCAVRNGTLLGLTSTADDEKLIERLYDVTQTFLAREYGDELRVYRGLTHSTGEFVKDVLENPRESELELHLSCVSNFSTSQIVAREYGLAVYTTTIDRQDILLAPDFVLKFTEDDQVKFKDAEVQVRGDVTTTVDRCDVTLPSTDVPVFEPLLNPDRYGRAEHEEVATLLATAAAADLSLTQTDARELVWTWFDRYRDIVGVANVTQLSTLDSRLRSLCGGV